MPTDRKILEDAIKSGMSDGNTRTWHLIAFAAVDAFQVAADAAESAAETYRKKNGTAGTRTPRRIG